MSECIPVRRHVLHHQFGVPPVARQKSSDFTPCFVTVGLMLCLLLICRPAEGQEAATTAPASSYSRLTDPKLADSIKLSDEQRVQIANLITQRAEALAKAGPDERAQILAQNEKDLESVLTEEQRALFQKEAAEPRLRFNFRFQRWTDVLEWLAKQSDLSLVLDAPPPGTFNYSDTKEYTATEAQDLLNGVLSTKGYTLIRRGRMLMVIDVQEGIPDGLIPTIPLEELDKRGKFELVSVMFPLGTRDPQAVKTEITPLLGPFGKSVLLAQTKQLLVTDTAGIIRAVNAVISSIPQAEPEKAKPPAPVPEMVVYPVKAADGKVAEEVLVKMFPAAKIVADLKAEQINAFATPAEQVAIKGVLEQMQTHNPPDKRPVLEVYPVRDQDATQLVANLLLVAPTARVTFDSRERQIVAFATPNDQANLKTAIEKLAVAGPVDRSRQLEIYRLSTADPSTTLTLLQGLLPQAKFTLDPQTRRIVAFASTDDHKAIKAVLEQIQSTVEGPDTAKLEFYPLEQPLSSSAMTVLTTIAPKAKIVSDPEAKRLQVLATATDQAVIKENLDSLLKEMPPVEKRKLSFYKVVPAQKARFQAILPSLNTEFPDIRVVAEGEPNELAIWAKPSQHDLLKNLIESLVNAPVEGEELQLVTHPLRSADPTTATTILKTLVPQAKVSLDTTNRHLVAIATAEDHKAIKSTIEKLQPGDLGPDTPILRFYPVEQPLPASALVAFSKLVPKATVTPDVDGKWLQVVATTADHDLIKTHLDEILKGMPIAEKKKLSVYPVTPAQRVRFLTVLPSVRTDLPEIRVITDGEPNELAIWAKPSQHELLKGIFEELVREVPVTEKYQLVAYPLKVADATSASTVLQTLFPGSKITIDATSNRLLIWTRRTDHAEIKKAIEELDSDQGGERQDKVIVYPVPEIDPDVAIGLLQGILPKVRLMKDTKARTIVAWAKKGEHEAIARTLGSMRTSADGEQKPRLKYFPPGKFNAASVIDVLRVAIPTVRMAVDPKSGGLVALGTVAEHEQIQSAIAQIASQPEGPAQQLVTYQLPRAGAVSAFQILSQATPDARPAIGQDPSRLLVWARPEDHLIVEKIVEQLEADSTAKKKFELRPYSLKATGAATVIPLLGRAVPKATLNVGNTPNRLIAWALPEDHEVIEQVIKQFDAVHAPDTTVEFFDIQNVDADSAMRLAQAMLQKDSAGTSVSVIPGSNQLYVEARAEQHEMIRDGLKRLKSSSESGFEVFQLEVVDPLSAESMIRRMFSGARSAAPAVEPDLATQRLYVRGTTEQIQRVEDLLEKMGEKGLSQREPGGTRKMRVVPFGGDTSAALKEILRIWPKLRSNQLRIIPSSDRSSNLLLPGSTLEKNANASDNLPPAKTPPTRERTNGTKSASPIPPASQPQQQDDDAPDDDELEDDLLEEEDEATAPLNDLTQDKVDQPDAKEGTPTRGTGASIGVQTQSDEPVPDAGAPIVILPRDGNITIFSEDSEALDQFDKLLRAMSGPQQMGGRGFAVYGLKIAGATQVAETLRQALRAQSGGGFRSAGGGPTVVADERLNAIIVHGSRADRAGIESLLEVLDSSEIPDSKASNRPKRVSVKHGSAAQIEQVLRLVYKSQLSTGGGRKELPIPSGLAPEITATLQQLNAMNSGPVLALSVDEVTNSIVIMAPGALAEQVTSLIKELDEASLTENSRGISIVPLERMNSTKTQKVLNLILEKSRRRDRRN